MRKYELTQKSFNEIINNIELRADSWNSHKVNEGKFTIEVQVCVDGYYELQALEVFIYDEDGEEYDITNEQYIDLRNDIENILYELSEEAKAEERWVNYMMNKAS